MPHLLLKLILCLAFISWTIWYGKTYFYRDPGSIFYDEVHAFEQRYSLHRRSEVDAFIRLQNTTLTTEPPIKSGPNPTLCLAFSSVRRQTTSALATLTSQERQDLHVAIHIAEPNPFSHPNWNTTWLRTIADTFTTYNASIAELSHLSHLQLTSNYAEKGIIDYTQALQLCHTTGAPYIALFEDDILLANTWFIRTLLGLSQIPPSKANSWLFMRLFNQERSTGWASRAIGGNNEHWIILAIAVSISLVGYLARRQSRIARSWVDWGLESARKTSKTEAQAVWSMAFEDLDPVVLEREHSRFVDDYYWRQIV
ncbi:hypothetical protein APSETT444_004666 [Aspergillus pseudonomiae]